MTLDKRGFQLPLSVLPIDDSDDFLKALKYLFELDPRFELAAGTHCGNEGYCEAARQQSDVVLMDLVLPISAGTAAIRAVKALPHSPRVIVLTLHDQDEYRRAALAAGADGFIAKADSGSMLTDLIRSFFPDARFVGARSISYKKG